MRKNIRRTDSKGDKIMKDEIKGDVINDVVLAIVMAVLALSWIYFLSTGYNVNFLEYETISCILIGANITASIFSAHRAYKRSQENLCD